MKDLNNIYGNQRGIDNTFTKSVRLLYLCIWCRRVKRKKSGQQWLPSLNTETLLVRRSVWQELFFMKDAFEYVKDKVVIYYF